MHNRILFITPNLENVGAPRSMLRMCKVARDLGYDVSVWSRNPGPLCAEYQENGFDVRILSTLDAFRRSVRNEIKQFDLAVCNTIELERYERLCSRYIPTVWYVREAANIHFFLKCHRTRLSTLKRSRNIVCLSEYAAEALKKYTKQELRVVRNCIEDESGIVNALTPGCSERVRFFQLGSLEHRKGYDVILAAYGAMPADYQERSELIFAGRITPSTAEYANNILKYLNTLPNGHYMGELMGIERLKAIGEMDVVIVASRDDACALTALEGAMLSRPLIVTENVGGKYVVKADSGMIVKTDDVENMKSAMMQMIDKKDKLAEMGRQSRLHYEEMASMEVYEHSMEQLFKLCEKKYSKAFKYERLRNSIVMRPYIAEGLDLCSAVLMRLKLIIRKTE